MSNAHHTYDRHHTTQTYKTSRQDTHDGPSEISPIGVVVFGAVALIMALSAWEKLKKKADTQQDADKARGLLQKASAADRRWRPDLVRKRLDAIFPDVQRAMRTGDLTAVEGHMTERGLRGLHGRLDTAMQAGFRYEIDEPKLKTARALFVVDKTADAGDILWMEVNGRRACYQVAVCDGCLREGDKQDVGDFTELWKLVHGEGDQWLVDGIVPPGGVDGMMKTLKRMYKSVA